MAPKATPKSKVKPRVEVEANLRADAEESVAQAPTPQATPKSTAKAMSGKETSKPTPDPKAASKPKRVRNRNKPVAAAPPQKYNVLSSTIGDAAPVTVTYQHDEVESKTSEKTGGFEHSLVLHGLGPFRLVTSVILEEGPYSGHQAILIKTSKPFRFMDLTPEIRRNVHGFVLAPENTKDEKIRINNGGTGRSIINAKEYNAGGKFRLGMLMVNKQMYDETQPILYGHHFKVENLGAILIFLTQIGRAAREMLNSLEITNYQKTSAAAAFFMLTECRNLNRLHLSAGVALNCSSEKAAKTFHGEAYAFLESVGSRRNKKDAGLDVLRFGKSVKCFSIKDGSELRAWDDDEKDEFVEIVRAKLK